MKKRMRNEQTDDLGDSDLLQEEGRELDTSHSIKSSDDAISLFQDNGHRYGNFHNYYNFNPALNRTSCMHEIFEFVMATWNQIENQSSEEPSTFRYLDIGCNEGDLTLEVTKLLSQRMNPTHSISDVAESKNCAKNATVHITGMDLDAELIQRAQAKFLQQTELHSTIQANFQVVDVLKDGIAVRNGDKTLSTLNSMYRADLTSLFSTTMWLHIHGGDEGLRRVLQQICSCTQYWILLEPQPSKCYATAAFRLRRMGMEPLDVSNERLQLRSNIEEAIELILNENNFERISPEDKSRGDDTGLPVCVDWTTNHLRSTGARETKTPWNRSLRLYGRVACNRNNFRTDS